MPALEPVALERSAQLEIIDLRKRFGSTKAVDGISLSLSAGESLCVVGPNGAGKTTLLLLAGGVILPNSGHVTVFGMNRWKDNFAIRERSIFLTAEPIFGAARTPYEFLRFYAQIYRIEKRTFLEKVKTLAEALDMSAQLKKPWGALSLGMIKKVGIIGAYLPEVDLRIFDEPFAGGIDPHAMDCLYRWFEEGKQRGETIIFSTQVLEQAETASDRLLLMERGIAKAFGTPEEIMRQANVVPGTPRALYQAFIALTK